jgi:hypothetical protein
MNEPEEFRDEVRVTESYKTEPLRSDVSGAGESGRAGGEPLGKSLGAQLPVGNPLPTGSPLPAGHPLGAAPGGVYDSGMHRAATPPGRALTTAQGTGEESPTVQRIMNALKQAMPFVQRLLPLIDGHVGTAVANMLTARQQQQQAPPPAPEVDLTPVQNQISDLQLQHTELRATVQEQTTGLKRVEDQLEMVREATDRNTLEQQELIEDLRAMGGKVNLVAVLLALLLVISLGVNLWLFFYIKRLLP